MLLFDLLKGEPGSLFLSTVDAAAFVESEHPREQTGKFTAGAGSNKGPSSETRSESSNEGRADVITKGYDTPEAKKAIEGIFNGVEKAKIEIKASDIHPKHEFSVNTTGAGFKSTLTVDRKAKDIFVDEVHISRTKQGRDIGKNMIHNMIAFAKKEGMQTISLWAAEKVGIYAWAKLGFDYDQPTGLQDAKASLKIYCKDNGIKLGKEDLNKLKTAKDVASLTINDETVGKNFMLSGSHGSWTGVLKI
jgi:GNAT superfamily N-acetyltransferase